MGPPKKTICGPSLELVIGSTWDGRPLEAGAQIVVVLSSVPDGYQIVVDAPFYDDPSPAAPPGSTDGLWEFEVVELFIAGPNERYIELELGPHSHFLLLQFDGIRRRLGEPLPLKYSALLDGHRWRGQALLTRDQIPRGPHRLNAYAIRGASQRHYCAYNPIPGEKPDFHRLEQFIDVVLPEIRTL